MSTYLFDTLPHNRDTIRLLVLEPTVKPETSVRCRLISIKMSDKPVYEAVSYNWGEPSPTQLVHVNQTSIKITTNLHDCLLRLRDTERSRILWIDAICINQNDNEERSHQIDLMPYIYSRARRVVAWLGESADGSDDVLTWIIDHREKLRNSSGLQPPESLLEPITRFFERQYWYRTWIIQELLKAQKQLFICGGCQISAFKLFCFVEQCTYGELHKRLKILVWGAWEDSPKTAPGISFPQLLQLSSDTNCADDRDKIYALLGLLHVTDPEHVLKADYTISTTKLFHEVLKVTNILTEDESRGIQVRSLLKALHLSWKALNTTWPTLEPDFKRPSLYRDKIWCNIILSTSFQALGNCTGVIWVTTKDVHFEDILITSPKIPNFYFALRGYDRKPWYDREWTCVGLTWVTYNGCAGYCSDLKAIDCFFKDFEYYHREVLFRLEKGDIGLRKSYILVPKLLSAAIQLYQDLGSRLNS